MDAMTLRLGALMGLGFLGLQWGCAPLCSSSSEDCLDDETCVDQHCVKTSSVAQGASSGAPASSTGGTSGSGASSASASSSGEACEPLVLTATNPLVLGENGGLATFGVRLCRQPSAEVLVLITSLSPRVSFEPSLLVINADNWSTNQDVTAVGLDDVEDNPADTFFQTLAASSADVFFEGESATLAVRVDDDEAKEIRLTHLDPEPLVEGGTAQFRVRLGARPTGNVTLSLEAALGLAAPLSGALEVSPPTLTFTPDNFNDEQPVTVVVADDPIAEAAEDTLTLTASIVTGSTVPEWDGVPPASVAVGLGTMTTLCWCSRARKA